MEGRCVRENDGRRDLAARWGEDREMPYRVWHAGSRVQKNSKTGPPALVRSTDAVVFLAKVAWLSSRLFN